MSGKFFLIGTVNALVDARSPERKTASTPSVFHFSMKLVSCAWAAVKSPEVPTSSTAVVPRSMPAFFNSGTIVPLTTADSVESPSTATVLPSSVPCFWMSLMRIDADPSGTDPGVTIRPAGDLSMIACVRLNVISTRFSCLATHVCASPEKSTNVPTTPKTSSSCVNAVHSWRMPAEPSGE